MEVNFMNIRLSAAALIATTVFLGNAHAQGTFDFSNIPGLDKRPTVQISLNPAMLGFVSAATRGSDPATADLIAGLEGISVNVYEGVGDALPAVLEFINRAAGALERDGWQSAVNIQDGKDEVRIYLRTGSGAQASHVTGLTVMVADGGGDAVFVNIAGTIDPAKLGQIANAVGMQGMLDGLMGLGSVPGVTGGAGGDGAQQP
jgi:hypothetical protein